MKARTSIEGEASSPRRVRMEEALPEIHALISRSRRTPTVIAITGPVGSGKSTLASRLAPCIISTDSYLPDYDTLPEHQRDLPEHADIDLLATHIGQLRTAGAARIPVWSFHSHRRDGWQDLRTSGTLIVVEGIHAFDARLASQVDVAVLVEARRETRWARWEALEASGARGWGVEKARAYFESVAEPTFHARAADHLGRASIVVIND